MSAWGGWGERGDDPRDFFFFCLLSAQQSQAVSTESRAGCIPRHLVLQININGGTQTGTPPLPGSPAPCPLGEASWCGGGRRRGGGKTSVLVDDGSTRCARCGGLNPRPHLDLGRGLPAPADSSTAPAAAAARAAFRVSERPPLPPPSVLVPCVLREAAGMGPRPPSRRGCSGWRTTSAPQHPRLATQEPCGALGRGTRFCRVHPPKGHGAARSVGWKCQVQRTAMFFAFIMLFSYLPLTKAYPDPQVTVP